MRVLTEFGFSKFRDKWSGWLLIAVWMLGNLSALEWLVESLKHASLLNKVLLGIIVTLGAIALWRHRGSLKWTDRPGSRVFPVLLMLIASMLSIAFRWLADFPQINLCLFSIGSYGLMGLFLAPSLWRKGLAPALLLSCFVALSAQLQTGLGFPLRVLSARIVEKVLSIWQIPAISSHDIIVVENRLARVDLPCSGLRSMWTGTVLLVTATWWERRQIGMRWLLVCVFNCLLLLGANVTRVLLLVTIEEVWQQPLIARILHVPLGIIGFICALGLTWLSLQTVPRWDECGEFPRRDRSTRNPIWAWLLAVAMVLTLVTQFIPKPEMTLTLAKVELPANTIARSLPLSEAERRFFKDAKNAIVSKERFTFGNLSGSILLVTSLDWQAQHPPELCLVGIGLKIDKMERKFLGESIEARWLSLQDGKLSATYWFQSPYKTTDDFLVRIWDAINKDKTWVLVSVLFDTSYQPDNPEITAFATDLYNAIKNQLSPTIARN